MSGWEVELDATAGSGRQAPRGPLGRGPDAVGVGGGGCHALPSEKSIPGRGNSMCQGSEAGTTSCVGEKAGGSLGLELIRAGQWGGRKG